MPCGGIWPCAPLIEEISPDYCCFYCDKWLGPSGKTPDHHCEEWDCALHGDCVEAFLKTKEGRLVIDHGHVIQVDDIVLQKEAEEAE